MSGEIRQIDQWIFDYYVHSIVNKFKKEDQGITEHYHWNHVIKIMTEEHLDANLVENKVKANLLLIIDYQLNLVKIKCPWLSEMFQSSDYVKGILTLLDELQTALTNLHDVSKENVVYASMENLLRECLIQTYSMVFQVFIKLKDSFSEVFSQNQSMLYMKNTLELLKTLIINEEPQERKLIDVCQMIIETGAIGTSDVFPPPSNFHAMLKALICEIYSINFCKPHLITMVEANRRLTQKLAADGDEGPLSTRPSLKNDIGQISDEQKVAQLSTPDVDIIDSDNQTSQPIEPKDKSRILRRKLLEGTPIRRNLLDIKSRKVASHDTAKIGRWTTTEEDKFIVAVLKIGIGKWAEVKEDIGSIRSSVQLKDKWRGLTKTKINAVAKEHGMSAKNLKKSK